MKKNKVIRIVIIFALFLVLLITYFIIKNSNEEITDETEENSETTEVLSVSADDIYALTFKISDQEVTFIKSKDIWQLNSDQDFPVDSEQLTVLTDALSTITADRVLENMQDLDEYGLSEPGNIITVSKTDGSQDIINVGDTNSSSGYCYIYLNDATDKIYAVDGDLATVFAGSLLNYAMETEYPTITGSDIIDIQVKMSKSSYHLKSTDSSSTGWEITDSEGESKEADSTNLGTLQSAIAGFSFTRYYEYRCDDMSEYGLDKPYAVITAKYMVQAESEDASEDSEAEQVEEEIIIYIGNEDQDGNRYVRINDSLEVHAIAVDSLQEVLDGNGSSYETTMITNVLMEDIDSVDITVSGKTHSLHSKSVITEDEETETSYYLDDVEMESSDYLGLFSKITALSWQEKLTEKVDLSDPSDLTITFKMKDKSTVEIDCIPYDSSFYAVTVDNGEQQLVNKMKIKEIIETINELVK